MNLLETTEIVQSTNKVYIMRLNNGALVAAQINGSSDDENIIFLDNPCFMQITPEKILLETMIPTSVVKTINAGMNMDHILMMWEASDAFSVYYASTINKYASYMVEKLSDSNPNKAENKKKKDNKTPETNVINFANFKKAKDEQKSKEEVVSDEPTETDDGPETA